MSLVWFGRGTGREERSARRTQDVPIGVLPPLRTRVFQFDWSQSEPLHSTLCIPAIALPLIIGIHWGDPGMGVLMATGAMCVGFGSFQKPLFGRSGPMLASGVGITLSAITGALAAHSTLALILITALWAFLYGISNAISPVAAWVGLQCCIYLIISSVAPTVGGGLRGVVELALLKGSGMLAGSAIQYTFIRLIWFLFPSVAPAHNDAELNRNHYGFAHIRQQLTLESFHCRFALRLAVTAIIAVGLYRYLRFNNAYWIAMTAMILPHPELAFTTLRTIHRFAGTLLGAGLATLIVVFLRPSGDILVALVLVFAWLSYVLGSVNYGAFVLVITGYIAFLLAITRAPEEATLKNRIVATLIGGSIGLTIHLIAIPINRVFIKRSLRLSEAPSEMASDGLAVR